jgi:hypothetical protein
MGFLQGLRTALEHATRVMGKINFYTSLAVSSKRVEDSERSNMLIEYNNYNNKYLIGDAIASAFKYMERGGS